MANDRIKATLLFATGILLAQSSRDLALHVEVNLVQVDAEVTDGKGRPVTDLSAADFEIRQDGKPQRITNFSYIDTTGGAGAAPRAPQVKGAPPLPPVDLQPEDVRRTFVVVVDDLGVAWENLPAVRHALRKFVEEEKQPNDLVAVVATGGGMGVFQQFSTDPKQLLAAVDHLKFNLIFNRVGVSSFPSIGPLRMPLNPVSGYVSRQQSAFSIQSVLRVLRDMPGRKIMLLISEEMSMVQGDTFVQRLGDRAIRSSVAIYTVDPRGLPTLQLTAADNTRGMTPQQISRIPMDRSESYFYLVFWPFAGGLHLPDMRGGRNRSLWSERIESAWASYFGAPEKFLSAAYQLEFILEFNSYVLEVVKPEGIFRLEDPDRKRYFAYEPDFWANRLDDTVPIAELFYDALAAGPRVPAGCGIDERAIDLTFKRMAAHDRLLFLGGFLTHLKSWQAGVMLRASRFPFMFDWEGRLKAVSFEHVQSTKAR
jgi:VWFA-related protein